MKKLSVFLSAVLVFMMAAASLGTPQTVEAFPYSEINDSEYRWNNSAKAGTRIYFGCSLDYDTAAALDVTGWKAALCPVDNQTLTGAVVTFNFTNADKLINDQWKFATLNREMVLEHDIPGGEYVRVIFDAAGNVVYVNSSVGNYVEKTLMSAECDIMNNDGYVYAYVYSDNPTLNAYGYPTLYAADKTTALTTYNNYTTMKSSWGSTIHVYRLNILNPAEFQLDEEESVTYFYYKMGKDAYGNDLGVSYSDANGMGYTSVVDGNRVAATYGTEPVDPFAGMEDTGNTPVNTTGLVAGADGNWYLYDNGVVNTNYTGLYCDANVGWWLVRGGQVDFNYTGFWNDPVYGCWLIGGGAVCFDYNGLWYDEAYGWWLVNGGAVNFGYTGLYYDVNLGWWLINGGTVDFGYTGLYNDANLGWWLVNGGAVNFDYTGLYCDANAGWWLIGGGAVCFDYNGLWDDPQQGWWLINGGAPAFGYTGLVENETGWWYVENGTINFNYTGQVPFNGGTYNVVNGYVVF